MGSSLLFPKFGLALGLVLLVLLLGQLEQGHARRLNRRGEGNDDSSSSSFKDSDTRFIDLTHAFNNETAVWPGRKITFFTEFERYDENNVWTASYGFCTSEHTSTHIDAPYHFNPKGRRLHEIPFEDLIDVPGVMIDIYEKVHTVKDGKVVVNENYALTREDVIEWEQKNGKIPQGSVVLLRTGWDTRWGDPKLFRGEKNNAPSSPLEPTEEELVKEENSQVSKQFYDPTQSEISKELSFPAFHESAAKFLAVERAVKGVGVDVISIDPGNQNILSPAHITFANRNIYMLEMVANLYALPPRGFNLWMVPFKIDRGTGAPTRVIARLNDN